MRFIYSPMRCVVVVNVHFDGRPNLSALFTLRDSSLSFQVWPDFLFRVAA